MEGMEYDSASDDGLQMETSPVIVSNWSSQYFQHSVSNIGTHFTQERPISVEKYQGSVLGNHSALSNNWQTAVNSFSSFRSTNPMSPQEADKSLEKTSDEDEDHYSNGNNNSLKNLAASQTFTFSSKLSCHFDTLFSGSSNSVNDIPKKVIENNCAPLSFEDDRQQTQIFNWNLPIDRQDCSVDYDNTEHSWMGYDNDKIMFKEGSIKLPQNQSQKRKIEVSKSAHKSNMTNCCIISMKSFLVINLLVVVAAVSLKLFSPSCGSPYEYDAQKLKSVLLMNVYGQHIATNIIPDSLDSYFSEVKNEMASKPLVISLHGWTGVGKNFISQIITEFIQNSRITKFLVPLHFAHSSLSKVYATQIKEWIISNVTKSCVNFFLLDEMDKADDDVIRGFHEAIKYLSVPEFKKTSLIFLILSNSRASSINQYVFQQVEHSKNREVLSINDMREILSQSSNQWYEQITDIVDVFVPFLPLELRHVAQCVKKDMTMKGLEVEKHAVMQVLDEMNFFTVKSGIKYSHTGCKRVSDKVNFVLS